MLSFRPLTRSDFPLLHDWLCRPHVAQWWPPPASFTQVEEEFAPYIAPGSTTHGYIALRDDEAIGFIQSYIAMGSGEGWWPAETDPGTRGVDQYLANAHQLGRGLGSAMVSAFVERLFTDPAVTKVQTDPHPTNERAIRCYRRAGFVPVEEIVTPDGPALLMLRYRQD